MTAKPAFLFPKMIFVIVKKLFRPLLVYVFICISKPIMGLALIHINAWALLCFVVVLGGNRQQFVWQRPGGAKRGGVGVVQGGVAQV